MPETSSKSVISKPGGLLQPHGISTAKDPVIEACKDEDFIIVQNAAFNGDDDHTANSANETAIHYEQDAILDEYISNGHKSEEGYYATANGLTGVETYEL